MPQDRFTKTLPPQLLQFAAACCLLLAAGTVAPLLGLLLGLLSALWHTRPRECQ